MSSVDGLCGRGYTKRRGKVGEANTLSMVEEHATIEKFRLGLRFPAQLIQFPDTVWHMVSLRNGRHLCKCRPDKFPIICGLVE